MHEAGGHRDAAALTRRGFLIGSASALAVGGLTSTLGGCAGGSRSGSGGRGGEVNVITWGGGDKVQQLADAFKAATGITLRLIPGEGDDDFYSKVRAGGGDEYDVVITNTGFVPLYEEAGLIEILDPRDFDVAAEIYPEFLTDERFVHVKGPNQIAAFPNQWGSYGLTYTLTGPYADEPPDSWEALWDVPSGEVMLDGFYVTNLALAGRMIGLAWDEVFAMTGDDLDAATERLIELRPFALAEAEPQMIEAYQSGSVTIGMVYSLGFGSTVNRSAGSEVAATVLPEEGVVGALDGQLLVKGARNRDNALELINFLAGREAQTIFWDLYRGPTANQEATEAILARGGIDEELMRAQLGDDPEVAAGLTQLRSPDDAEGWNLAWDRVLAS